MSVSVTDVCLSEHRCTQSPEEEADPGEMDLDAVVLCLTWGCELNLGLCKSSRCSL